MTEIHRIRGVAGAGKSTKMMKLTEQLRSDNGYYPSDFRWISFSRHHAADLRTDVVDAWGGDATGETLAEYVSTLHSLCVSLTNPEHIITPDENGSFYETFWRRRGFDLDTEESDEFTSPDDVDSDLDSAEKLLAADQLLAQLGVGVDGEGPVMGARAFSRIPVDVDLPVSRATELVEEWRDVKEEHGAREHHDYILDAANSTKVPDCDVLMVDEMQDYSPLEYAVIRDWIDSGEIDHVVLAGDEYQSIYGFKLAAPRYFVDREVDREDVLNESYRCPKEVCQVAQRICPESGISAATDDRGVVFDANVPDPSDLGRLTRRLLDDHPLDSYNPDPPSVFVLCRTNRQASKVGWGLRKAGIPYTSTESDATPWSDDVLDAIETLRAVADGRSAVSRSQAESIIEMASNSSERKNMLQAPSYGSLRSASATAVDIYSAFPQCDGASEIVDRLTVEDYVQEMVVGAMHSDVDLSPGRVEVGTIHSVKGREAPAVVVMDGYSHNLAQTYETDDEFRAEENRLGYVAATRASETLVFARDFLNGKSFTPLDGVLQDNQTKMTSRKGVTSDD